jgi:ribonuclease HI
LKHGLTVVASRRNPGGHAAYGALVIVNGVETLADGQYVCGGPTASNNVAEYSGILAVLQWIDKSAGESCEKIIIRGDSKLVINQLGGSWNTNCTNCGDPLKRCSCEKKTPGLYYPFYEQARDLYQVLKKRHKITLKWIPRKENEVCDVYSKKVLLDRGIKFKIQPEVAA